MYENENESVIKDRMLSKVPSDISRLEGSFVYDAISPVSIELSNIYMILETFMDNVFIQTTKGEYLKKRAEEFGIEKKEGTKAKCLVTFQGKDGEYPKGILIETKEGYKFKTVDKLIVSASSGTVMAEAEECGSKYNVLKNTIVKIPIQVLGLTSVINGAAALGGTDEESDEDLLKRLMVRIQNPSTSGNKNHYKMWALEVPGVGDVKVVTPSSDDSNLQRGDVKLILLSSDKRAVSKEIIDKTKEYVDIVRPIGVNLIVESAIEKDLTIDAQVSFSDYTLDDIKKEYEIKINEYRKEIAFKENEVSHAKIGYLLLTVKGVKNYKNLKINGEIQNFGLKENEVPKITVNIVPM